MKIRALVVEDDERIAEAIEDILFSMGHEHDWAASQQAAREFLRQNQYAYILQDLQIPAKTGRGGASVQYGQNLLKEIQEMKNHANVPVIVMTGYLTECLNMVNDLRALGAREFIAKPFPETGRTLVALITKVLSQSGLEPQSNNTQDTSETSTQPANSEPFNGGEIVFTPARVELCGVKICGDFGQVRGILEALAVKRASGKFTAYSGEELAKRVDADGQTGIAGAIRDLRKNVTKILKAEANIECANDDFILSGGSGYRLAENIKVRQEKDSAEAAKPLLNETENENTAAWILEALRRGVKLTSGAVKAQFECSDKTVQRALDELRAKGHKIKFEGHSKNGFYRLF